MQSLLICGTAIPRKLYGILVANPPRMLKKVQRKLNHQRNIYSTLRLKVALWCFFFSHLKWPLLKVYFSLHGTNFRIQCRSTTSYSFPSVQPPSSDSTTIWPLKALTSENCLSSLSSSLYFFPLSSKDSITLQCNRLLACPGIQQSFTTISIKKHMLFRVRWECGVMWFCSPHDIC